MRPDLAPGHVARIKELVRAGFYDGIVFHRVIDGFMAQTGCPQGTGTGGSGKKLKAEFNKEPHRRGTVSMARAQNPEFRRQPVLHLLRGCIVSERPVHRLGSGDRRHGERRQDQARGAGAESRSHHFRDDGCGRLTAPASGRGAWLVLDTHASPANHSCSIRQTGHCTRAKNTGVALKLRAIGGESGRNFPAGARAFDHDRAHGPLPSSYSRAVP